MFYWASRDMLRRNRERTAAAQLWIRECRTSWHSALAPIIRHKLRNGRLPSTRPARTFGGPGAGGRCSALRDRADGRRQLGDRDNRPVPLTVEDRLISMDEAVRR